MGKPKAPKPAKKVTAARRQSTKLAKVPDAATLVTEIGRMIEAAQEHVARAANAALTTLYWARSGGALRAEASATSHSGTWCGSPRRSPTPKLSPRCGDNCRGPTSSTSSTSTTLCDTSSTRRCAPPRAGARAPWRRRSTACSTSVPRSRRSPSISSAPSSAPCATMARSLPTSSSRTHTCSTSSVDRAHHQQALRRVVDRACSPMPYVS